MKPDWRMPRPIRRAARGVAEALFHADEGPPDPARLEWMLDDIEDFLGRAGVRSQAIFQASITALTALAPLTVGRPLPLFLLPVKTRAKAIERFEQTPLGLAVLGAKATLCIVYYEHPDSAAEIGFDGGCMSGVTREAS